MPGMRRAPRHPTAPPEIDAYLERFAWHPEPALIGYRDETASRTALEQLRERTWAAALDYIYGTAMDRAMRAPADYPEARRRYYGDAGDGPAPAQLRPMAA